MVNGNQSEKSKLLYPELGYAVYGAIYEVWNKLGPVFKESIYQKALEEEFRIKKIQFEGQKQIPIYYENKKIGLYVPDFIVEDKIIIEIKYLPALTGREKKQAWHYLKATDYKLLLLVNFGGKQLEIFRYVYDKARIKN